ncbi:hypothetical protein KUCAC02_002139 [Chaenocephalus aceratus]|uniref:Uncharacterized protein n=1 Tax=Chaenocephalus aceratus TaxID=36190 RepID=A0ACB9XV94_CHAAC|nr:hypothetical protein KUCAC02_002139 [Chaenocephalus aceratus]
MMSEAALEEVSVLSSIYCGEGELRVRQQDAQDGLMVQINSSVGGERRLDVSLLFHLHPPYPLCPPAISVSSSSLSRTQCQDIRQKLLGQAAALPPEPMVHRLVERLQPPVSSLPASCLPAFCLPASQPPASQPPASQPPASQPPSLQPPASSLPLCYSEFCRLLKTVKVDVDSSGRKCKERMMKVLIESPSSPSAGHGLQGFVVKSYESIPELSAAFQELNMTEIYQQILPSLSG